MGEMLRAAGGDQVNKVLTWGKPARSAATRRRNCESQSTRRTVPGRNDPCPRGSDKKFKRHHGTPDSQCAIKTGKDALAKMCRVAPPKIICRNRLWV